MHTLGGNVWGVKNISKKILTSFVRLFSHHCESHFIVSSLVWLQLRSTGHKKHIRYVLMIKTQTRHNVKRKKWVHTLGGNVWGVKNIVKKFLTSFERLFSRHCKSHFIVSSLVRLQLRSKGHKKHIRYVLMIKTQTRHHVERKKKVQTQGGNVWGVKNIVKHISHIVVRSHVIVSLTSL